MGGWRRQGEGIIYAYDPATGSGWRYAPDLSEVEVQVALRELERLRTKLALMKQAYLEQVRLLEARDAGAQRGGQVQAVDEETSGAGERSQR